MNTPMTDYEAREFIRNMKDVATSPFEDDSWARRFLKKMLRYDRKERRRARMRRKRLHGWA